jgi:hypothetical protein
MADHGDTTVRSAAREWLFKSNGHVFGPVPEGRLAELLEAREIGPGTEVAGEDGAWRPLASVPGFLVHLRRAEARARVESEVTAARQLARRQRALRGAVIAAIAVVVAGAAAGGAFWLAARRARTSALLEDFGGGIAIGGVTVGVGARADAEDEIAVPSPPAPGEPAGAPRPKRAGAARAAAPAPSQGGGLVLAQYDPKRIEEVVARRKGSLAPCLRDESQRSPDFAGDIPIEFAVGNDGHVAQLWVNEPRFKSGALRECLVRKLSEWSFDAFPGERPIVSIAFRIGGR